MDEFYNFTWYGKTNAVKEADTPTDKTMVECREESVDFDNTNNLFIEGDNLDALKLLREKYTGKVKMIYIDPPYNTGNKFLYKDNFNLKDKKLSEGDRRHAGWLNMMYPRLKLARELLRDDGVIFISIDDNEQKNLKSLCDEIFGEESFITTLHVQMSSVQGQKVKAAKQGNIVKNAEYVLIYGKSRKKSIAKNILYETTGYDTHYSSVLIPQKNNSYKERKLREVLLENKDAVTILKRLDLIKNNQTTNNSIAEAYDKDRAFKEIIHDMSSMIVRNHTASSDPELESLSLSQDKIIKFENKSRSYLLTLGSKNQIIQKIPLSDKIKRSSGFDSEYGCTTIRGDWWPDFYKDMGNVSKEAGIVFLNGKKPVRLIYQMIYMLDVQAGDIVLDFFAGSSTTAHAVMERNMKDNQQCQFIMVQLPEVCDEKTEAAKAGYSTIAELSKERIRRAAKQIKEEHTETKADLGFKVFKLV